MDPEIKEVKIVVSGDSSLADATMAKVGAQAEAMGDRVGKGSQSGRLALWGMGEAAENAAQSLGVPNQISRQLGNTVEHLAGRLGTVAVAFGGIALAGMALYGIYEVLIERKRKLTEATLKASESAEQWILSNINAADKTDALYRAEYNLYLFRFEKEQKALKVGIELKQKQIEQLKDEIEQREELGARLHEMVLGTGQKVLTQKKELLSESQKELAVEHEVMRLRAKSFVDFRSGGKSRKDDVTVTNQFAPEAAYQRQLTELYKANGADRAAVWQQELAAFDWMTASKMADAKSEQEYYDTLAQREMEREVMVMERKNQLYQQDMQNRATMLGGVSQVMDQMYQISGKKMKAFFLLSRSAAAAEAFIHYELAAAKAVGQTGLFGIPMATYFHAMAKIVPALIMAQTFAGLSGGGGGAEATPAFNANPTTGLPANQQPPAGPSIYISIDGGKNFDKVEMTKNVLQTIYDNNGSLGGLSVSVERHA